MFNKNQKTKKQKETLVKEGETMLGKQKTFSLPKDTKAVEMVKDLYDKIKNEKEGEEERSVIIFTKKGDEAQIVSHASKRDFTKFVMAAVDSDCVDVDVLEKFLKLYRLKSIAYKNFSDIDTLKNLLKEVI